MLINTFKHFILLRFCILKKIIPSAIEGFSSTILGVFGLQVLRIIFFELFFVQF